MEFVAIDFETANRNANSACQLAAVRVLAGEIVEERCWLIRPPGNYFAPMNIGIHGIRPRDVADAPTMEQVWSEISPLIDGQVLIAHNARFDMGVLVQSLAAFDIACPSMEFSCTKVLAKAAWPGKSAYGLKPLGTWLGVDFKHHDALEDSRCCARIALAVSKATEHSSLSDLEKALRITRGQYRNSRLVGPRKIGQRSGGRAGSNTTDRWGFPSKGSKRLLGGVDATAVVAAAASELPLKGKRIVMLGPLRGLGLDETLKLITRLGAEAQSGITATTDYVVACGTSLENAKEFLRQAIAAPDTLTTSHREKDPNQLSTSATQYTAMPPNVGAPLTDNESGEPHRKSGIRVLSERQFVALLPAGKATVSW